ncbi:MAG TPA: Rid family detoxifying hydrolase [Blastocatellia bacterium]|nr:Rid family detoxifying hydrolase [Blastocatellia bacterium]
MDRRRFMKRGGATAVGAAVAARAGGREAASAQAGRPSGRSNRRKVQTDRAPKPVGPYSQAIVAGNTIYVAGQVAINPRTGQPVTGSFEQQAVQVFENVKAILEAAGATLADVVRVNVYLANLSDFGTLNEIYRRYFSEDFPARTTVGAQLLSAYSIEVDCIAVV